MKDAYCRILKHLHALKVAHPEVTMGKHIATVLDDQLAWGISDKELLILFNAYAKSLNMEEHSATAMDKIINDGMCLDRFKLYEDADEPPEEIF